LVTVSGYRIEEILQLAHQRFSTILVGGATCIIVSIFVCPVWAGEDLHELIASNLEKLANYLEGNIYTIGILCIYFDLENVTKELKKIDMI
jgi:hypothetical protein